ncbi:MAG: hypothetical protein U9Q77_00545, partial [Candidatus Marinimicrobia bacterium]|nr:hypothetical protein [Candidatus Neomarinimicrobiota bacterium]
TIDYEYISVGIIDHFHAEDSQIAIAGLDNSNITINFSYDEYSTEPTVAWVSLAGFYINLVTASQDQLPPSVWELYAEFEDLVAEYSGELYRYPSISFYWDGSITTGTSLIIDGNVNIYYEERGTAYVEPDPQWDATTYAEWLTAWPDPTMHGIFPDMDATGLAEFLGFNEDNWEDFSN